MRLKHQWWRGLVAAVLGGLVGVTAVAAAGAQFIPILGFREGTLRALGIPQADGLIANVTLLNERDGGIHGVPVVWEECETVWDVPRGIECYERLKTTGPTGASDGRVFPYVFNGPSNSWSQNTAKIRFIGQRAGGMVHLKGRKIVHVYYDNDYGRETLALLDQQAAQYGFTVQHLALQPQRRRSAVWPWRASDGGVEQCHMGGGQCGHGRRPRRQALALHRRPPSRLCAHPCRDRGCETVPWGTSEWRVEGWPLGGTGLGTRTRVTSGGNLPPSEVIMSRLQNCLSTAMYGRMKS